MRRQSEIRVPKTTAMFVTMLYRILREELKFDIYGHEHWTFHHVADWSTFSLREDDTELGFDRQHEFDLSAYIGVGRAELMEMCETKPGLRWHHKELNIRVHIERNYWVAAGLGPQFCVNIWVKLPSGEVTKRSFIYWEDDGSLYENEKASIPDSPPRKIAFWRGELESATENGRRR